MKTLNAKRVAAIAAGAALLGVGLAFAGSVTFQNVPIISNSGQPVVQVVVGSAAKVSDGIAAANIAAAIGNLAYTSVPVTATVNATQAKKVLKVSVTSASGVGGVSNPEVWLNESASAAPSGTYAFSALIGSVLNRAVVLGSPYYTKSLQGTGQYSNPESNSLSSSPTSSPYYSISFVPFQTVSASTNGGGLSFSGGFRSTTYDNILQVTNANLAALLQNSGAYGENEYLWLTGFPVFDQGTTSSPVNQFALASAGGAYQVTFNKPIPILTGSNTVNQPSITLLGKTWTILNYTAPTAAGVNQMGTSGGVTSTTDAFGGSVTLAASLVPLTTVYVGHNLTTGPFTVQVTDLGQPNANGVVPASLAIYYNGQLTNTSATTPPGTVKFNVTGNLLYVKVNQTFAGLYQYQKWAKIQMFSNVEPMTNGNAWNSTTNPGWQVILGWTNSTSGTKVNALQTIIAYNITPVAALMTGQSFSFIGDPAAYKMTLAGDTLGNNFDALSATVSSSGGVNYQNTGVTTGGGLGNINNITEPAQYLTITSQIPNAFSYAGQVASSVTYDLTPYLLTESANSLTKGGLTSGITAYVFANTIAPYNGLINGNNQLTITVYGYPTNTATSQVSNSFTLSSIGVASASYASNSVVTTLYNVTKITLSEAIPGMTVTVANVANGGNTLATLTSALPQILYTPASSQPYTYAATTAAQAATVVYNQQNGQPTSNVVLTTLAPAPALDVGTAYAVANMVIWENPIPGSTQLTDALGFEMMNSTVGGVAAAGTMFQMNYSLGGTHNNVSYVPSSGSYINARTAFRTEKGSKVASISPTAIVLDLAKAVDELSIDVGTTSSGVASTAYKLYGPYGLGQLTNLANVSIGKVTANVSLGSGSTYSITGISNITATPSVSSATTPVLLTSLATTPLVVNDSTASGTGSLILVGSGYVNTLSAQLQRSYNISMTPTVQIDAAYGTNRILVAGYYASQTTAAANAFIAQLYANAASS